MGTGTIQASHLVEAGRKMIGLNGDRFASVEDEEMTAEEVADMFDLDDDDRDRLDQEN